MCWRIEYVNDECNCRIHAEISALQLANRDLQFQLTFNKSPETSLLEEQIQNGLYITDKYFLGFARGQGMVNLVLNFS